MIDRQPALFPSSRRLIMLVVSIAAVAAPGRLPAQASPVLTTARSVRSLTAEQADQARPVRLRGVVTSTSGGKNSFFLQDATLGIFIFRTQASPRLERGQEVEVQGVTGKGDFAPLVLAGRVKVLGAGRLPPTRIYSLDRLAWGNQDSQWLAIRGVVRSAAERPVGDGRHEILMKQDIGGGTLVTETIAIYSKADLALLDRLPGSTVVVRGVCGTVYNNRRQFVGLWMFLQNLSDVTMERPAPADPFDTPLRQIGSMLQFSDAQGAINRVKVRGIVTYTQPKQGFYLQDGAQGIFVRSSQSMPVALGSQVEAVGFPSLGGYSPALEDALFRVTGRVPPLSGQVQSASNMIALNQAFSGAPYDSLLVRLTGQLLEEVPGAEEDLLILKDGNTAFTARLPSSAQKHPALAPGSLLSITGICVGKIDSSGEARAFEILLRSPADLVVLKHASWWTAAHVRNVAAVFIVAFLLGWLNILRRQAFLRELSMTDQLTGLYNRRGFLLLAEHQRQVALRNRAMILLFYIDLDRFKEINDTLGHKQGDLALQSLTAVLRECFRSTDIVGRLGGDEFAITTVDATPESRVMLEGRLAEAVRQLNKRPERPFQLSLSVGVLTCDESLISSSIEDLLGRADALMYEQKRARRSGSYNDPPAVADRTETTVRRSKS